MISGIKKSLIGTAGILVAAVSLGITAPAYADDDPTTNVTLPPGQYSGAGSTGSDWSCDMMATGTYAPCVQNTPTTGDEAWQKGYKLTFNWTTPLDWRGNPYDRCVLSYYNPATEYTGESMAPYQIDVPAAWGSYTIPLSRYGWLEDGIKAGATTLKEEYYCYTDKVGSSTRITSNSAIIPDMPPTTPTDVDASTQQGNVDEENKVVTVESGTADLSGSQVTNSDSTSVDLAVSGSQAVGVSPLDGYSLVLTNDATGGNVANVNVAPEASTVAGTMKTSRVALSKGKPFKALNRASSTVKNLQPGTYTLSVASYNKIGTSYPYTVKLVVKKGSKVTTVKSVKAHVKGKKVTTTWSAIKGSTGYVVQAVKGNKVVKTVKVSAKAHTAAISLPKGSYTVRVASLNGNRVSVPSNAKVRIR